MYFENDNYNISNKNNLNYEYYKLLGLEKEATSEDIRKAYKKLLKTHHPDKGGDSKVFQNLQIAYETLSDPDRKIVYDKYGEEGLKQNNFNENTDNNNNNQKSKMPKAPSTLYSLRVQLEEVYTGVTKELKTIRERLCTDCKGSGCILNTIKYDCKNCNGLGSVINTVKSIFGVMQQKSKCNICNGEGKFIKSEDYCKKCKGKKKLDDVKLLLVEIEKGVSDGHRYKFNKEGNEIAGYETGDIIVELFLENKTVFKRKGADLITSIDITIIEAFTPFEICLTHLDSTKIYIQHCFDIKDKKNLCNNVIQPGSIKTVKDAGMPFFTNSSKYGNLHIFFNVVIPKLDNNIKFKISDETQAIVNNINNQDESIDKNIKSVKMINFDKIHLNTDEKGGKSVENDKKNNEEYNEDEFDYNNFNYYKTRFQYTN